MLTILSLSLSLSLSLFRFNYCDGIKITERRT
jgi:hypothetical protein